eukprot:1700582-Rhodomonas_salina.1
MPNARGRWGGCYLGRARGGSLGRAGDGAGPVLGGAGREHGSRRVGRAVQGAFQVLVRHVLHRDGRRRRVQAGTPPHPTSIPRSA